MTNTLELAYDYLDDIEAFLDGKLNAERTTSMLVAMLNDGLGFKLRGALRDELDRQVACGRIVSVIQPAWDDLNECVMESAYEKDAEAAGLAYTVMDGRV